MSAATAVAETHTAHQVHQDVVSSATAALADLEQRLADGDAEVTAAQLAEARAEVDRAHALVAGDQRRLEVAQAALALEQAEAAKAAYVTAYAESEEALRAVVAETLDSLIALSEAAQRHASTVQLAGGPLRSAGLTPKDVGIHPVTPSPADLLDVVGAVTAIRLGHLSGLVYPPGALEPYRALLP